MKPSAFAILSVLVFVALLSVLVTSFLVFMQLDRTSTQNYSQAALAQELALSSLDEITGDLLMEIEAGSRPDGVPTGAQYTQDGIRVFMPADPRAAVPARIGFNLDEYSADTTAGKIPPTLLRVSRAADPFFENPPDYFEASKLPPNRASAASSKERSANGKWLTGRKWNKPILLGKTVPAEFEKQPPDWVYVTRAGSRVCTAAELPSLVSSPNLSNSSQVLGRYAFAIYDEGALLDINAAGYPATLKQHTDGPAAIGGKSAIMYADLTQLPGLSGQEEKIEEIVNWRNKGSLARHGSHFKMLSELLRGGFLSLEPQDSPVMNRQDLIELIGQKIGNTDALPCLGTFSRTLNAPAHTPRTPTGSLADYAANAEAASARNRNLANLRWPQSATIVHYKDDGTTESYNVAPGELQINRRFSLAKLAWLGIDGPNSTAFAASADAGKAIRDCFGLRWDAGVGSWQYDELPSSDRKIKTLAQVAAENREPNFFELLAAGILDGSVGQHPGEGGSGGVAGIHFPEYSGEKNRHILQIGANIIDQYDEDSFPTGIEATLLVPATGDAELDRIFNTVYGIENLPYLHRIYGLAFEDPLTSVPNDPDQQNFKFWILPELWNLHQQARTSSTGQKPEHFRLRAYGGAYGNWRLFEYTDPELSADTVKSAGAYSASNPDHRNVYFRWSGTSRFFQKPQLLTATDLAAAPDGSETEQINYRNPSVIPANFVLNPSAFANFQFAGIYVGEAEYYRNYLPLNETTNLWWKHNYVITQIIPDPSYTLVLQYWDGKGWRPYTMMARIGKILEGDEALAGNNNTSDRINYCDGTLNMEDRSFVHAPDPRTDRLSLQQRRGSKWRAETSIYQRPNPAQDQQETERDFQGGFPRQSAGFHYLVEGEPVDPLVWKYGSDTFVQAAGWMRNRVEHKPTTSRIHTYYNDPDGIVRPADGFRAWASASGSGDGFYLPHYNNATQSKDRRRPVVLDRPFRSAGELGYAYRDLPGRNLDFWSTASADAALLDLFSLTDEPLISAGNISPNNAPVEVLKAMLCGAMQMQPPTGGTNTTLDATAAQKISQTIAGRALESDANPIVDRADYALELGSLINKALAPDNVNPDALDPQGEPGAAAANKAMAEAPARTLAGVTNTRTWNLMVDVVAQSGRFPKNAKTLADFLVEGEKRYWLHIAIDRYTGKIIAKQLEPVYE